MAVAGNGGIGRSLGGVSNLVTFVKPSRAPCLVKTGPGSLSLQAGVMVVVAGRVMAFMVDTPVAMPALVAGTDYAVYVCSDGTVRADASTTAPAGYAATNSRKIGGFHYGLVIPGQTVAGGGFATAGNGMIWVQSDVDRLAGINAWSIWDLRYRPACNDPRGMVCVGGRVWVDIYFCSPDVAVNGTSRANTPVASGTVLPKIPAAFGGNGVSAYSNLNWWVANELARSVGKRPILEHEFVEAAYGVTEAQSLGGAAETIPVTTRQQGFTSKYGIEQATGHIRTWGMDSGQVGEAFAWQNVTGGRGSTYTTGHTRVTLGGNRDFGSNSGSRCSFWDNSPWNSLWHIGLRAACDHLEHE